MPIVVDTGILIAYARTDRVSVFIEEQYKLLSSDTEVFVSVVSIAEVYTIASRNKWGKAKLRILNAVIDSFIILNVDRGLLVEAYLEIELYNHNRHPIDKRSGSSIKMGKNDLWVAATALLKKAELLTTDGDFDHLDPIFFPVHRIDPKGR